MSLSGLAGDPFDALGDPHRRAIVELLGHGGRSVREIADALPISRPAVSRHLRLLKAAGLVAEEPHGTRRIYHLRAEGVEAVQRYLAQVWGEAAARFRLVAENTPPADEPRALQSSRAPDARRAPQPPRSPKESRPPDARRALQPRAPEAEP
jgi:DNA-binding transcriptional ArsR family regulator